MTVAEVQHELSLGGRFVMFQYVISVFIVTFRRSSDVYFVRSGESAAMKSLPYTALTLLFGWWGFPFGLIYTPMALATNLGGGKDVTPAIVQSFR